MASDSSSTEAAAGSSSNGTTAAASSSTATTNGSANKSKEEELAPETWKAWFVCGIMFPFHIVFGVLSIPTICYLLLVQRSILIGMFVAIYIPFYLYPAQTKYPGWKLDFIWNWMDYETTCKSYFGKFDVIGSENLLQGKKSSSKQYFVGCHPHGTVIFQRMFWRTSQLSQLFDRPWRMIGASILFYIPIVREATLFFGAVDASKQNCERLLKQGVNVVVFPGGLDEANSTDHQDEHGPVHIRTRTGFIRLAIKYGTDVLPIFTFGELESVQSVLPLGKQLSQYIRETFRMSTNVFIGRYYSFVPLRVPFYLCIGKPISVNSNVMGDKAAEEKEVERVHSLYKAELRRIYEQNKDACGYEGRELVFECESLAKTAKATKVSSSTAVTENNTNGSTD